MTYKELMSEILSDELYAVVALSLDAEGTKGEVTHVLCDLGIHPGTPVVLASVVELA